jgi:branched-subunit amino acid transport protein
MNFEAFSTKWFAIYYSLVALCLIGGGAYLMLKKQQVANFFLDAAEQENPPSALIRILKYILFFTLPGLVLSFLPFSWIELLFTLWSLLLVYIAGIQLVRWNNSRTLIKASTQKLPAIAQRSGAIMVAVGFAIFLLAYLVINRTSI